MSFLLRCKRSDFEGVSEETIIDYLDAVRDTIDRDDLRGSVSIGTILNPIRVIDRMGHLTVSFAITDDSIMVEIPDIGNFNRKVHLDGCFLFLDKKRLAEILSTVDYIDNALLNYSSDLTCLIRFKCNDGFIDLRQFLVGTTEAARALYHADRSGVIKELLYDLAICGDRSYEHFSKRSLRRNTRTNITNGEMLEIIETQYPGIKDQIKNEIELRNSFKVKREQQELEDWLTHLTFTYTESRILFTLQGAYSHIDQQLKAIAEHVYESNGTLKLPKTPYVEIEERLNNAYAKVSTNQKYLDDVLVEK